MTSAFLDTTIVCDALLAQDKRKKEVRAAVDAYSSSEVCEYAFREFGAGPLWTWIFAYNTLVTRETVQDAIAHLQQAGSFRPRAGWGAVSAIVNGLIHAAKVGALPEEELKDALLGFILREVQMAWASRHSVARVVKHPLSCLRESEFEIRDGALRTDSGSVAPSCDPRVPCSAAEHLRNSKDEVEALVKALRPPKGATPKKESTKRRHALKEVLKARAGEFPRSHCRDLGDAYFCVMSPSDAEILTTNVSDFGPLAAALRKNIKKV